MSAPEMRVAVVGGNLLGCAAAFRVRAARPAARVVLFERAPRLGGRKFATVRAAVVGSAANVDVSSAPLLTALLRDARVQLQSRRARREWALFDWSLDSYKLSRSRCALLRSALASRFVPAVLQLVALCFTLYLGAAFGSGASPFVRYARRTGAYVHYPSVLMFATAAVLGFGIIPTALMLRAYDFLFQVFWVRIVASITYGGESMSVLSSIMSQMHHHLQTIQKYDSASSCVTLGHLLSACGMAKFVKQSASRYFSQFRLHPSILDDAIYPCLSQPYADSNVAQNMNALAALLGMLATAPIPSSRRAKPCLLSAQDARTICPRLADAASAEVHLNTEVTHVESTSNGWQLFCQRENGERQSLGSYDAVILAAVVDPSRFSVTGLQEDLTESLALSTKFMEADSHNTQVNVAKYTAVVTGTLNAEYVRQSSEDDLPTLVTVLNSVNCAEIQRIEPGMWRVVTGERPTSTSNVIQTLFKSVEDIVVYENPKRPYKCTTLAELNGAQAPSFILGTRFLNAACVDRVANDINLDCLSAINTASFFNDKVATWKE